jgi:hypothetical protein
VILLDAAASAAGAGAAALGSLASRAFWSLVYVLVFLVWWAGTWRKRRAAEAVFGAELADALGPVVLLMRVRQWFGVVVFEQ